jgi:cell division protein FtsA
MLKSGLVITGGVAETANLSNFIYELSGYRVRTGYPKGQFSTVGCNGIKDPSAATSVGLILAAKDELGINCAQTFRQAGTSVVIETGEETYQAAQTPENPYEEPLSEASHEEETQQIEDENRKPEEKPQKKSIWDGINIFWSRTKKKAEEAAARTGEVLDGLRNEEV